MTSPSVYYVVGQQERDNFPSFSITSCLLACLPANMSSSATSSVQILGSSCVKPLHATKRFHLFLPFADSSLKRLPYTRDVLFYSLDAAGSFNLQALKHGLSLALVHFYPVAGRLHEDAETGQLTIDCDDGGVEFVEAVTDCTFAELEEKSFPIHDFYDDLARFCFKNAQPRNPVPLLSIQVTRFQDGGGIAIGVAASHVVFDGHSLWYFLKSWGQCCRGQGLSLPPLHARALMSSEFWGMDKLSKNISPKNDINAPLPPHCAKAGYHKVMHFDSTIAQQLKRTAIEESGNVRISTFQVVIACVWKRISAAQDLPPHQKMRLHIPGDVRHRLMPSLTDAYFGNAVVGITISTTVGELQRESLGATAAKIKESLKVLEDQAYLRGRMATREEKFSNFLDEMFRDGGQTLFVARGLRLPVYDVDVGVGKPVAVRPATIHSTFQICIHSGREEGSVDVSVCFFSLQTLQAFLSIPSPCIDI